ncbi:MAG: FAD-dependent oxidoreductase, partial [Actinomycetota bacterium]
MAAIAIVGDGPGGLSAALFLAKAGHDVKVLGKDSTVMHYAYLHNYLGAPDISGSDFQAAARAQAAAQGAALIETEVSAVAQTDGGFEVTSEAGT